MSPKFNTRDTRRAIAIGPLTATPDTEHVNHQGGVGYTRTDQADAYLLATTSLDLTAEAFYESGDARVKRFVDLIGKTAVTDPNWTYQFLTWLRSKGNIRTAAVVGGVEAARAMAASGIPGGRHMVSTVLQRADEPGEAVAYHLAKHGRKLPMPVKRGVADAAARLYSERSLLKYDTASHGVRFADVLDLTHPRPQSEWQGDLFTYALNRRHGHDEMVPVGLGTVTANRLLRDRWTNTVGPGLLAEVNAGDLDDAGMTWEDTLSLLGNKVDKAALWKSLIPNMGFMARLRNLRNFDQTGLSDADVQPVIDMLGNPDRIRRSRQLPLRFLSAYRAAPSLRWSYPLQQALDVSVENIPALPGRTLILIDTSGSMNDRMSGRTELLRWDAAVSFGLALARACDDAEVWSYSGGGYSRVRDRRFDLRAGESLLTSIGRWKTEGFMLNGGTDTAGTLKDRYNGHDRAVILTDEQDGGLSWGAHYGQVGKVTDQMPKDRPLYTFNLAGYQSSHAATDPNRLVLGGLTDHMFGLISQVEKRIPGHWPWSGDPDIGHLPSYERPVGAVTR